MSHGSGRRPSLTSAQATARIRRAIHHPLARSIDYRRRALALAPASGSRLTLKFEEVDQLLVFKLVKALRLGAVGRELGGEVAPGFHAKQVCAMHDLPKLGANSFRVVLVSDTSPGIWGSPVV